MSPTRLASAVLLTGVLALAAGCGGSKVDPDPGALGTTADPTPTPAETPSASPTMSATPPATVSKSPKATADEGDGGDDGNQAPSTAGGGVCGHLGASQVGA